MFQETEEEIVSEAIQDMTIKQKLPVASYLVPAFSPHSRLVVVLKTSTAISSAPSRGFHGS